ncbi:MAG: GAF domain-containing protein [Verrucomicrobiae bacterium]|nr:GAF domain-containing protein [Verrucomicrobiae bacterium]NNJ43752.1 GAF domain-containing protein [Akkermansiaceae bacterium]
MLDGERDDVARMATVSAVLAGEFDYFYWTGFYRMQAGGLVIGPYQGTPGCLRIALDRGICGAAVRQGETLVVDNVHVFPGHIACDAKSRSEIVVPVWNAAGMLVAVLDIDSEQVGAFGDIDRLGLERIVAAVFACEETPCQNALD